MLTAPAAAKPQAPLLFPHPDTACVTLAFHAAAAWPRRKRVREVLEQGGERCRLCGTRVAGWMEIDHLNRDHSDWRRENLAPVCHFCHLTQHPVQTGFGDGDHPVEVIHWPEITQTALCALAWAAVRTAVREDEAATAARPEEARALKTVLTQTREEIRRRKRTASQLAPAKPQALLTMAVRAGGEPQAWSGLRWWPAAAEDNGELFRWLPGGLQRVKAQEIGAKGE